MPSDLGPHGDEEPIQARDYVAFLKELAEGPGAVGPTAEGFIAMQIQSLQKAGAQCQRTLAYHRGQLISHEHSLNEINRAIHALEDAQKNLGHVER